MSDASGKCLIRGHQLVDDTWTVTTLAEGETAESIAVPPAPTLVPLALWLGRKLELLARQNSDGHPLGVWLGPTDEPGDLANDLPLLGLVAVHFPKFADGRGYSTASLLRQRYRYRGELRAIGDIGRDQLFYLARVGFDSFLIPEGRNPEAALGGLDDFPEVYQAATDQPQPLFRRRAT